MVGPSNTVPLYSLELPVQVSVIPVFTTEDFVSALTQLASLLDPPPPGPLCAVVQMYTNITLDDFDVPAGGFEVPCQVLVQGLPDGVNYYGTSLDLALQAPLFRLTGLGAMVFR